jgi:hypothetical protein
MSEQKFENFNTIKILKGTQLFIDLDPVSILSDLPYLFPVWNLKSQVQ